MNAKLYVVATPIGNLSDLSPRAVEILSMVDRILVEDTRHSKKLLSHFHIQKPLLAYHDHNESQIVDQIIQYLQAGESCALISDAGTPAISDPGYRLISAAHVHGINVVPVPGCSALIAAISASGLVVEPFQFVGFAPSKPRQRQSLFEQLSHSPNTLVYYESPHRILDSLNDASKIFGAERPACLARELTKLYEEIRSQTLGELYDYLQQATDKQRGEFVVIIQGVNADNVTVDEQEINRVLKILLADHSTRQASELAAKILQVSKNQCYQLALKLKQGS